MPARTCVVCREKEEKQDLLRFVLKEKAVAGVESRTGEGGGELCLDAEQKLPGRGVYCHARVGCLAQPKLALLAAAAIRRGSRRGAAAEVPAGNGFAKGTVGTAQLLNDARKALMDKSKGGKEKLPVRAILMLEKLEALRQELEQTGLKAQSAGRKVRIRI